MSSSLVGKKQLTGTEVFDQWADARAQYRSTPNWVTFKDLILAQEAALDRFPCLPRIEAADIKAAVTAEDAQ